MSHTTTIDGITFVDMNALTQTVADLNRTGVRCSLERDQAPRAYYSQQAGMETAPFVLKLQDSRYDVGFYPNPEKGGLEARTDFWGGDVEKILGNPASNVEESVQAKLGKLYQGYAVCAIERQAIMEGRTVSRSVKDDGTVQLVVGG